MASTSGWADIEKFNGTNFELWKLKLEDLLFDRDLWSVVSGIKPLGMKQEDWDLTNQMARGLIRLSLADSVLLNVHEEKIANSLWKKLGDIYQGKSLVNKIFLRKKLYSLKIDGWMALVDHLISFNMVIAQLISIGVSIDEEDRCMLLLCSLPDSWDHLVMAIKSMTTKLKMDEVVATLLSEEMWKKSSKATKEALSVRGRSKEKSKKKDTMSKS